MHFEQVKSTERTLKYLIAGVWNKQGGLETSEGTNMQGVGISGEGGGRKNAVKSKIILR